MASQLTTNIRVFVFLLLLILFAGAAPAYLVMVNGEKMTVNKFTVLDGVLDFRVGSIEAPLLLKKVSRLTIQNDIREIRRGQTWCKAVIELATADSLSKPLVGWLRIGEDFAGVGPAGKMVIPLTALSQIGFKPDSTTVK